MESNKSKIVKEWEPQPINTAVEKKYTDHKHGYADSNIKKTSKNFINDTEKIMSSYKLHKNNDTLAPPPKVSVIN